MYEMYSDLSQLGDQGGKKNKQTKKQNIFPPRNWNLAFFPVCLIQCGVKLAFKKKKAVLRQHLHCIQYKIAVVYFFGNKKWQQLSVSSHNQRYLQERNNDGSLDQLPHFQQVQTLTFFAMVCIATLSLLNIRTCSFQHHFGFHT